MGIMVAIDERADSVASRAERAAAQSERAADRADTRARDADRISRWIVGLMIALFLALLLQGFETRLALGSLRTELQDATLDRAAIRTEIGALRTELQGEIGALRTELQDEIGALRTELTESQAEIIAVVSDVATELTRSDSPIDRPALPSR